MSRTPDKVTFDDSGAVYDAVAMVDERPTARYTEPQPLYHFAHPQTGPAINDGVPPPHYVGPPNGVGTASPLASGVVIQNVVLPPAPAPGPLYVCGHCKGQFRYHRARGLPKCPLCHKTNSVGYNMHCRGITYLVFGIIFLLLGIGVTVLTYLTDTGYFFVWIGGIAIGIGFTLRGVIVLLTIRAAQLIAQHTVAVISA